METLLAVIVIVVFAAILTPLVLRSKSKNLLLEESGRMRQIYVALSLYEEQYDSLPAPNLVLASINDPNPKDFASDLDPFEKVQAESYPSDPGLDNGESSTFRISYSYLLNFTRAGKIQVKPWLETRTDPNIGILGNEWFGAVEAEQPFHAQVSGKLLRINTDGSVYVLPDRGGPKALGNPQDLFLKR